MKTTRPDANQSRTHFPMGRRLNSFQYIATAAIAAVSFSFYFIYDFLFVPIFPWLAGYPLALIFTGAALLLIALLRFVIQKVRAGVFYRLTPDALEYTLFGRTTAYPWTQFSAACYGRVSPGVICPVTFTFQNRDFRLNQYTEQVWLLAKEILSRIAPSAQVEPGLSAKIEAMSGV